MAKRYLETFAKPPQTHITFHIQTVENRKQDIVVYNAAGLEVFISTFSLIVAPVTRPAQRNGPIGPPTSALLILLISHRWCWLFHGC